MAARSYLPTIQSDISLDWERVNATSPKSPSSPLSPGSDGTGRINAGAFWKSRNSQGEGMDKPRSNDPYSYSSAQPPRPNNPPSASTITSKTPTISFGSPQSSFGSLDAPPNSKNDSGLSLPSSLFVSSPSATAGHSPAFPPSSNFLGPNGNGLDSNGYNAAPSSSAGSIYTNGQSSPAQGHDNDEDLMLSLMAGQASVDVGIEGYRIMSWEEVEDSKKELTLLTNRLGSLTARCQREQKILTAARTLDRLHANHKRMNKQTMEELAVAEKRAVSAEKDMWAVSEREAALRRRLNEHYASSLAWEARRLQRLNSANNRTSRNGPDAKGKERETELSLEIERLRERVRELEELVEDSGEREANVAGDMRQMRKELERERTMGKEMREEFEAQIVELRRRVQGQNQSSSDRNIHDSSEHARTILSPLLAFSPAPPPPEDASVDHLAQLVRNEYESLEAQVRESKVEMKAVREGLEGELARLTKDRDGLQKLGAEEEKRWMEERDTLKKQIVEAKRTRSTDSSGSNPAEYETTKAQLQSLWAILPSKPASALSPRTPSLGTSHRSNDSTSSRSMPTPSPSDFNFPALSQSYANGNGSSAPYPGLQAFADRVKALVEDGKMLVERTAKYAKERDIHKSNSERAQRLVQESRAGLERYQSQVRALEERLSAEGKNGDSLQQFNELENTISALREDKRRLEISLNAQIEACDSLSEANESLSTRALTLADEAAQEKRAMQIRLEAEIERLRTEITKIRDDMDDQRAREQGQGIALLDELNSLQDEVQTLRKQLRQKP
ncbi:Up-regulated during septation-domain-containing protein [Mrakia frigida]|uniref:Up-regulated during septation-domain-containing protein n=1 Tax=Mrakia frigida TaxID=29902 RepID=UPI003FCC03EB